MKKAVAYLGSITCALMLSHGAVADGHAKETKLESQEQKVGYSFGQMFGRRLSDNMPDIDINSFILGLRDVYGKKDAKMTEEEISKTIQAYQKEQQEKQMAARKELADKNLAAGQAYMKANAAKEGVKVTESGLQYKVIKEGQGESPKATDKVEVHYTGKLISGEVFDSSVQRGTPATFPVTGVIKGWIEALQLMKPGGKWELTIPAELAYGPNGTPRIGPNETLIFEVELLSIKK